MRVLFTAPFWSHRVNSIARAPIYLASRGHDILVITAQEADSLKGKVSAPPLEMVEGAEFFRPYPDSRDLTWRPGCRWREVEERVERFAPDVIVGFGDSFYRLPSRLSRRFGKPLVFFFEYLRPEKFSLPFRGAGKLRRLFPGLHERLSRAVRGHLSRKATAIMFSYYGDRSLIHEVERDCPEVRYVPWCTENEEQEGEESRDRRVGIYIGSLTGFKNAPELLRAIPLLLDRTATERFIVVGPGEYAPHIRRLAERYGPRLRYIESLPRAEAMRLLRTSSYGFTPVADCGLGFIGDCWGTGTPLVTTHRLDGLLAPGIDTLVADGVEDLPRAVDSLLGDERLYDALSRGGRSRYRKEFSARAVGEAYLEVLNKVVGPLEGERAAR